MSKNLCDDLSGDVEALLGGPLDGLVLQRTDKPVMYGGHIGDGVVCIYRRGVDGRLRYEGQHRVGGIVTVYSTSASNSSASFDFKWDQ